MIQSLIWMALFNGFSLAQLDVTNGAYTTCATLDGSVKCWGAGHYGALGTGNTDDQLTPPSDPVDLGAGFVARKTTCDSYPWSTRFGAMPDSSHCCAVSTEDKLKCWGQWEGTGYDIDDDIDSPEEMGDNLEELHGPWSGIRDVVAMSWSTCVLDDNDDLYCFGYNMYGTRNLFPEWDEYKNASEAVKVYDFKVAHFSGGPAYQCVVPSANEQSVTCNSAIKGDMSGDVGGVVESVQCGLNHCCALTTDKSLDCWGVGLSYDAIPDLPSDFNIQAVGVGYASTCVISTSGTVKCFGETDYHQLGGEDDDVTQYTFQLSSEFTISSIGITSGSWADHYCVFDKSSPRMQCWGRNDYGQLGYGDTTNLQYLPDMDMVDLGQERGHLVAKGRTSWGGWASSALDYYCQTDDDNQADYASKKHGYDIGVGCCSMDGTTGDRPDCGARPSTFEEAEAVCSEHDMRLCTLEEMLYGKSNGKGITEGTGCWFDAAYQWTASECVTTDQAAPSHGHGPNEAVDGGAISFDDLIPMALGAAAGAALIAAIVAMVVVMRKKKAAAKQTETELEAVHIPNTSTMTVSAEVTETANTEQMAEVEAVTVSTAEVDAVAVE